LVVLKMSFRLLRQIRIFLPASRRKFIIPFVKRGTILAADQGEVWRAEVERPQHHHLLISRAFYLDRHPQ
jgi:hypothetical protein